MGAAVNVTRTYSSPFSPCSSHFFDGGDVGLRLYENINQLGGGNFPIKGADIPGASSGRH